MSLRNRSQSVPNVPFVHDSKTVSNSGGRARSRSLFSPHNTVLPPLPRRPLPGPPPTRPVPKAKVLPSSDKPPSLHDTVPTTGPEVKSEHPSDEHPNKPSKTTPITPEKIKELLLLHLPDLKLFKPQLDSLISPLPTTSSDKNKTSRREEQKLRELRRQSRILETQLSHYNYLATEVPKLSFPMTDDIKKSMLETFQTYYNQRLNKLKVTHYDIAISLISRYESHLTACGSTPKIHNKISKLSDLKSQLSIFKGANPKGFPSLMTQDERNTIQKHRHKIVEIMRCALKLLICIATVGFATFFFDHMLKPSHGQKLLHEIDRLKESLDIYTSIGNKITANSPSLQTT